MRIIVCGTRGVPEVPAKLWLFSELSDLYETGHIYRVIHGDCPNSPDQWAKEWREENHVYCEPFPADWDAHGKAAGFIRNTKMAESAIEVGERAYTLAVWNGKSNGTRHMIEETVKRGFGVTIIPATLSP